MNEVITFIAESMTKAVGVAGIEAMAIRRSILAAWTEKARELADAVINSCIDLDSGHVYPERADHILSQYRIVLGEDFVEKVIDDIVTYTGEAYDRGQEFAYKSVFTGVIKGENYYLTDVIEPDGVKRSRGLYANSWREAETKARRRHPLEFVVGEFVERKNYSRKDNITESVITNLARITGASRENVQKTIERWFKNTQGEYFQRFIVPETARLLSYGQQQEGNIDTLRSIGDRYKKFVEADGYWSAVSEFNAESSKIFAQVQTFQELHISHYQIEAILDNKTCAVCEFLHGSEWSVEEAYERVLDMLIMEADQAYEVNPFPPRSTPKDYESPNDSPYGIPPFHPRCRCNIVSSHSVSMAPRKPTTTVPADTTPKPPTDTELNKLFTKYVSRAENSEINGLVNQYVSGGIDGDVVALGIRRELTNAEFKRVRQAFNDIPYEIRKWARENQTAYKIIAIPDSPGEVSRVIGNVIEINDKYLSGKVGPQVIQHELRHALMNKAVIRDRGGVAGAESLWEILTDKKSKIPMPIHVNSMYTMNRGAVKATAAVDEFMAMMGDYYKPGMSMDELVSALRMKGTGIEVEKRIGSLATNYAASRLWTAAEAKKAAQLWWEWMDIDNYTLMTKKQLLATMNYKPATAAVQAIAEENEKRLAKIFSAAGIKDVSRLGDNEPFDVWIGGNPAAYYAGTSKVKPSHVVELKTIVRAKNDKITMHPDALARKRSELKKLGKGTLGHTVVFDERTGKIYYREGVGSFRLSAMREVSESELQKLFGGEVAEVSQVEAPFPKVKYTPQTSIANAKKTLKSMFNVDKVEFFAGDDKLGHLSKEAQLLILNDAGKVLEESFNKSIYLRSTGGPKVTLKFYNQAVLPKNARPKDLTSPASWAASAYVQEDYKAGHYTGTYTMHVSAHQKQYTSKRTLHMGKKNWNVGNDSGPDLFAHEYGHVVMDRLRDYDTADDVWSDIWDWPIRKGFDLERSGAKVSEYATTNFNELWAESFGAYMSPKYKSGIPKQVEKAMVTLLNTRVGEEVRAAPSTIRMSRLAEKSKWKWSNVALSDDPKKARAAEKKFTTWMKKNFNNTTIEATDFSTFTPRQRIQYVNDIAKQLVKIQNSGEAILWTWVDENGLGLDRIMIHKGSNLNNAVVYGKTVVKGDNTTLGLFMKNFENKDTNKYENILLIAVDTSEELVTSGKKVSKLVEADLTLGAFNASSGSIGTFNHELGHALYYHLMDQESPYYNNWNKLYRQLRRESQPGFLGSRIEYGVSRYANTNASEAFAESFSAYVHKDYGINSIHRLPKEIEEFFNDLMKTGETWEMN